MHFAYKGLRLSMCDVVLLKRVTEIIMDTLATEETNE